jgi:cold shock CspA family protein
MAAERARTGTVTSFDAERGLGEVTDADGEVLPFHCTAIADGSRTIDEGLAVRFLVRPGPLGRWEASHLQPT